MEGDCSGVWVLMAAAVCGTIKPNQGEFGEAAWSRTRDDSERKTIPRRG